jgi:UDP-glucose:(heptosyl)LPS alpha-1,3-glucosyltransferase
VFPTQYDPFANVCLEALACGLPVVTTSSNGAAEILEEGRDGFVVSPGHAAVQGIVAKVMDFSSRSVQNKLAMKCTARKKAENFTVAKNAEQTLEILLNC